MVSNPFLFLTIRDGRVSFSFPILSARIGLSWEWRDGKLYITLVGAPPCWKLMMRYGSPQPDGTVVYGIWDNVGHGTGSVIVITPNEQSGSFQEFQVVEIPCPEETPVPEPQPEPEVPQ